MGRTSATSPARIARETTNRVRAQSETWLLVSKAAVAATLSWWLAAEVLQANPASFAPFSAVLALHTTVSRSVYQSVRFMIAMVGGIVLTGGLIPLLGGSTAAFALIVVTALLIGRWQRFGSHGWQVAVAVMFAYEHFAQRADWFSGWEQLGVLCGLVVLGSAVGVLTNLLIVPPLRYRSAEYGVRSLGQSVSELLGGFAEALAEGPPNRQRAQSLAEQAQKLADTATQAQQSIDDAIETQRFNPRRLLTSVPSFGGHRYTIRTLYRAVGNLQTMAREMDTEVLQNDDQQREWFEHCSALLRSLGAACGELGRVHSPADLRGNDALSDHLATAQQRCADLGTRTAQLQFPDPDQEPIFRALATDAHRVLDDLVTGYRSLTHLADGAGR